MALFSERLIVSSFWVITSSRCDGVPSPFFACAKLRAVKQNMSDAASKAVFILK
jgi:hypothetical protein